MRSHFPPAESVTGARDGVRVPHNRIHRILEAHGLASPDVKKQRPRRYVLYERPHSMDLWRTDWYMHVDGEWRVVFEDDASRLVTGTEVDRGLSELYKSFAFAQPQ